MPTLLLTAPYMIPVLDRFKPVFARAGIRLIVPDVQERMEEAGPDEICRPVRRRDLRR